LLANVNASPEASIGFSNGTVNYAIYNYSCSVAGDWRPATSHCVRLYEAEDVNVLYSGTVSVLGADGFTVSWTKSGGKTGTAKLYYMAFR